MKNNKENDLEIKKLKKHLADLALEYEAIKVCLGVRTGEIKTFTHEEVKREYGIK